MIYSTRFETEGLSSVRRLYKEDRPKRKLETILEPIQKSNIHWLHLAPGRNQ